MKLNAITIRPTFIYLLALFVSACEVNTLEDVEKLEQKVSLVQSESGTYTLKPENMIVDKTNLLVKKAVGVSLSGLRESEGFSGNLMLDFNDIPEGYEKLSPGEIFLTESATELQPIDRFEASAGVSQKAFYINITKAALDAHMGKKLAVRLKLSDVSGYTLNSGMSSAYILLNTSDFGTLKTDVTDTYFKNPVFARKTGSTGRFVNLQDWISNDAITNSRPTGAGFDGNAGFMGIERWASSDNSIINGKIYQTFNLPAGSYSVEVDMKKVAVDVNTYFVVNSGQSLPDASDVNSTITKTEITNSYNNQLLKSDFKLTAATQVSIGFLINIDLGVEKILQASRIRLFKVENLFD
ncbi:DUF5013 domain-containing protein [Desertivirga xinjiangensis]|uniref:DUF5013 domain-containing protein n=1 Tax=Desertivirga xinjiangensis TaxID=539206 RepID=UPI0021091E53|nr:DUF5013 domain-containing protein [Pedobacter xinjiangensis]